VAALILGYFLFDDGGILLLDRQFVAVLTRDKSSLFASLLTAITRAMEEILHQNPRHLELEETHLYFGYKSPFIFVLVSDSENEAYENLADVIAHELAEANLDPEEMHVSEIPRQLARQIIERHIAKTPLLVIDLRALANIIKTTSEFIRNKTKSELIVKIPKAIELKPEKVRPTKPKLKSFDELVGLYFDGRLSDVIKHSTGFFEGEYSDLARILFVKAGLTLRHYDPKVWAPSLERLYGVALEISDSIARSALIAEISSFLRIPSETPLSVYLKHSDTISGILQQESFRSTVYEILFTPIPIAPFLNMIIRKYESRSRYLCCLARENLMILQMMQQKPKSVDEWLLAFSRAKEEFDRSLKEKSHLLDHNYHILLSTLIWGVLTPDITVEDGLKLLDHFVRDIEKYRRELEERSERVTVSHKAWNIIWVYNILMRILLEIADFDERKKVMRRLQRNIIHSSKYFSELLDKRRIPIHLYYVTQISLISLLTRISAENNTAPEDIIDLLPNFAPRDIQNLFEIDTQSFYQYYLSFLETLGNLALLIDLHVVRINMLLKVAHLLERIAEAMSDAPIYRLLAKLFALRFYTLAGTKEALDSAKKMLSDARKEFSPFIVYVLEKIYEQHSRKSQSAS